MAFCKMSSRDYSAEIAYSVLSTLRHDLKCAQTDALRQLTYISNLEQQIEDLRQTNDDLSEELDIVYSMKVRPPQRCELAGEQAELEFFETGVEYSKLKTSVLNLIVKYHEKKTLRVRSAFDCWYDFAAEEHQAFARMPTVMREALDCTKYQEPFGPHSEGKFELLNMQGDYGWIDADSSDDDRLQMSPPAEQRQLRLIDQCSGLVQTVLKQCAVRMV